jgi:GWxTD domain-containing protein
MCDNKTISYFLSVICLFLFITIQAISQPVISWSDASFSIDDQSELELYLLVQRSSLEFLVSQEDPEIRIGGFGVRLQLTQAMKTVVDTSWSRIDNLFAGEGLGQGQKLPDRIRFKIQPGNYRTVLTISDLNTQQTRTFRKKIRVKDFSQQPALSGICFSSAEPQLATEGPFRRCGNRIIPYADAIYGKLISHLHGVNIVYTPSDGSEYFVTHTILGEMQNRIESSVPKSLSKLDKCENGYFSPFAMPVDHLPSGAYFLKTELTDAASKSIAAVEKSFWIVNPDIENSARRLGSDEYDFYSSTELSELWDKSKILANHYEMESWPGMDLETRREFIRNFWNARDTDKSTIVNEGKLIHLMRVDEADLKYGDRSHLGRETDRGRIFVIFGKPDDIETQPGELRNRFSFDLDSSLPSGTGSANSWMNSGMKEFEVWIYNYLEGGVHFIFVDQLGFGDYDLVHSTKSGEYYDPSWPNKIVQ